MSYLHFTSLYCEICGHVVSTYTSSLSVAERRARDAGWRIILPGHFHYCPEHRNYPKVTKKGERKP